MKSDCYATNVQQAIVGLTGHRLHAEAVVAFYVHVPRPLRRELWNILIGSPFPVELA